MERASIEEAYRLYFPLIRAKFGRTLRDPGAAQDLAQETFLRLWAQREVLRDPEAVVGWVYRTATRLAIDHLRRRRPELRETADGERPALDEERIDHARALRLLAATLRPEVLQALVLHRIDGLTQSEIARVNGTSERTVRRWLREGEAQARALGARDMAGEPA